MRGIELSATRPIRLHSSVKKRQCSVRQCVSERSPSPSLAANSAPTQSKGTICTSVTRRTSAGRPCQSSTISMSPASGIDSPSKSHDQARLQVPRFTPARMSAISDSESASESPNPPTRTYPLVRCMSCSAKSVTSSSTLLPIYFGILSIASIGIGISRGDCRRLMGCCRMFQNGRTQPDGERLGSTHSRPVGYDHEWPLPGQKPTSHGFIRHASRVFRFVYGRTA